jgi:hypothetical protein
MSLGCWLSQEVVQLWAFVIVIFKIWDVVLWIYLVKRDIDKKYGNRMNDTLN